jgi:hypothetical protein
VNISVDRGVKEADWRRISPILDTGVKLNIGNMASYRGHSYFCVPPRRTEIESKIIILNPVRGTSLGISLYAQLVAQHNSSTDFLTACVCPPERWFATAFAILGFSATQRIL